MRGEAGEVLGVDAVADHRRLVAHDVDTGQQPVEQVAVAYVASLDAGRHVAAGGVRGIDHRVHSDDLVAPPRAGRCRPGAR